MQLLLIWYATLLETGTIYESNIVLSTGRPSASVLASGHALANATSSSTDNREAGFHCWMSPKASAAATASGSGSTLERHYFLQSLVQIGKSWAA